MSDIRHWVCSASSHLVNTEYVWESHPPPPASRQLTTPITLHLPSLLSAARGPPESPWDIVIYMFTLTNQAVSDLTHPLILVTLNRPSADLA